MRFTSEQEKVVKHDVNGHIKVPAVAGAGKSTMLAGRVKYLVDHGIPANDILIVMFNVAAKDEFTKKLKKVIEGPIPDVRTFHALGLKLTKSFEKKGWLIPSQLEKRNYELTKLSKAALTRAKGICSSKISITESIVDDFVSFLDRTKSDIRGPEVIFTECNIHRDYTLFIDAFYLFEEQREASKIRFFSDLIYDPAMVLLENTEAREWVGAGHVNHVLLDEYQDINAISQYLIKVIANGHANVTCVGDADQCIYDFRGSRPDYIVKGFDEDFPDPSNLSLTKTFRYGHALSLMANHVITNNKLRDSKICISDRGNAPTEIELYQDGNPHPVVTAVNEWLQSGKKLSDIAVLVRLYSMSVRPELALLSSGIPYKIEGRPSVLNIPDICALMDLLKLAHGTLFDGSEDDVREAVRNILSLPSVRLDQKAYADLVDQIIAQKGKFTEAFSSISMRYSGYRAIKVEERGRILADVENSSDGSPYEILDQYIDATNLYKQLTQTTAFVDDAENRIETIESFMEYIEATHTPLDQLLQHVQKLKNHEHQNGQDDNRLLITSVHKSKGLEWPCVIIPELCEGKFPYIKGKSNNQAYDTLESERRLFYVAATRAREKLVLITPEDEDLVKWIRSYRCGYPNYISNDDSKASRFVYEANIKLSIELGKQLHQGIWLNESLKAANPEIANKYLIALGVPGRISKSKTNRGLSHAIE